MDQISYVKVIIGMTSCGMTFPIVQAICANFKNNGSECGKSMTFCIIVKVCLCRFLVFDIDIYIFSFSSLFTMSTTVSVLLLSFVVMTVTARSIEEENVMRDILSSK